MLKKGVNSLLVLSFLSRAGIIVGSANPKTKCHRQFTSRDHDARGMLNRACRGGDLRVRKSKPL